LRDEIISKLHQEVSVTDQKRSTEVFQLNNATEFENYQIYSNNRQEIDEVETKLPVKIIVVDDDPIVNMVLTHLLGNLKYEVLCFESPIVALEYLERNRVDIVVLDWHLPFMSGLDFIVEAEERHLANLNLINIIFCTSENIDLKNYEHFKNVKICDFWDKKSSLSTIVESIEKISLSLQR
jgi:CheY-like chemotaxis protein